ncbi:MULTISPECIES: twin-arginine translocation signal domain-containing protein [Dehalobacter]|nr:MULTISPECIES: twin-arginine translocation signal domain-containing protein [Dehalobacter]
MVNRRGFLRTGAAAAMGVMGAIAVPSKTTDCNYYIV